VALWRQHDFTRLWVAHTVSSLGSQVSAVALPLVAILTLGASAWQIGLLRAAAGMPVLVLGFFVGVWVDRLRRRPVLVATDLGRAALVAVVPLAALTGWLRIELLYAVALAVGTLSLFFDVAAQSLLPSVVSRDRLVEGNSRLLASGSVAGILGPAAGGWLVQLVSAPLALCADALSFLASALLLRGMRAVEPAPPPAAERRLRSEIGEGLVLLWRDPTLRAITGAATVGATGGSMHATLLVLYATETLRFSPALLGLVLAAGGAASLVGAGLAGGLAGRLGPGPSIVVGQLVLAAGTALLPLAAALPTAAAPIVGAGQALFSAAITVVGVNQLSLRQAVTPDRLQGRVNASRRVLVFGVQPLGALLAGGLGQAVGPAAALAVAAGVELAAFAIALLSPLPAIRETPPVAGTAPPAPAAASATGPGRPAGHH
jgi:predicted MFS family arabinose efflux permease